MKNITITATKLKENVSEILNTIHFKGATAIVKRHGKPIAKIVPMNETSSKEAPNLEALLDNYYGALPNMPPVTESRKFRARKVSL